MYKILLDYKLTNINKIYSHINYISIPICPFNFLNMFVSSNIRLKSKKYYLIKKLKI